MPQLQIIGDTPRRDPRPRSVRLAVGAVVGLFVEFAVTIRTSS